MIFLIDNNRRGIERFAFGYDLKVGQQSKHSVLGISVVLAAPKPMEFLLDKDSAAALVNGVASVLTLAGGMQIYVTEANPPGVFPGLDLEA